MKLCKNLDQDDIISEVWKTLGDQHIFSHLCYLANLGQERKKKSSIVPTHKKKVIYNIFQIIKELC